MKKLFKNKKGFTLMEMLIVVAIIVILISVSMPMFSSQLSKARKATNDANVRAAKAVATSEYLSEVKTAGTYYYDGVNGVLVKDGSNIQPYSKAEKESNPAVKEDQIIKVTITDAKGATGAERNGNVTTAWVAVPTP